MKSHEIIRWLEETGYSLINDDNGHWACVIDGVQLVPLTSDPTTISTSFFIEEDRWKSTITEAVEYASE